jgi:hypothetical protein
MKSKLHTTLTVILLTLAACKKQQTHETPPAPEVPTLTPSAIPQSTPIATPEQSPVLAPSPATSVESPSPATEAIYYVVKRFSVSTADGLHGFPVGKKVTLVREEGSDLVVTDGVMEGKASKDSFSTDQKTTEVIQQKHMIAAASNQAVQNAKAQEARLAAEKAEKDRQENVNTAKQNRIRTQIQQLDANISAASEALQKIYQAKARGGNIYDSYGHKIGARSTSASGDSKQLEYNISAWQQQRVALQKQLQ